MRFAVPESQDSSEVQLRLYNIMKRQVQSIGVSAKAGRHEKSVDVGGLSSGMYVLRLEAGGTAKTQKVVVVK